MPISAEDVRALHAYDLRILRALERLMKQYQWVPVDDIKRVTRFSESELQYRLGRLIDRGMVRSGDVGYGGYALVFGGYDALALHALASRDTIRALGSKIGEGKESVVYEAMGLGVVVLKFHRVGQRSFLSPRVTRGYMPESGHCPWIFASARSAEREYEALRRLHPRIRVPAPIDRNRHVVAMSLIRGANLNRSVVEDPERALSTILGMVREAYRCGVIHADLSEFNVMVDGEDYWLIDWPQWEEVSHPNAMALLEKDVGTILGYFGRKYGIAWSLQDAMAQVIG
ncbi:MAG: RIO1 family regulatory kinase/ATPase [Methanomicrobiales archaeon]|nr:RIO1 family regulatory kinase/ATPase [Methanomicrobiales archaeon]MDI6876158.1 RIO1 family regulatory kinase/ATPase [Methanomicrobiales archaeon]